MRISGGSPKRVRILNQAQRSEVSYRIPRPDSTAGIDWKLTAATRFLCAAAHLQPGLRRKLITELAQEEHRAIAPSPGIDPATVLKHCFAARRQENMRDLVLVCAWIVSLILAAVIFLPMVLPLWFFLFLGFAGIITAVDRWKTQFLVRRNLLKNNFNPDCVAIATPEFVNAAAELGQAQRSNVLVSSGFSPFAGAGHDVSGWSFAVDVDKGKEEFGKVVRPQSLSVVELYDELAQIVRALKIDGLTVEDKVCVNGQDIRDDRQLLPDPIRRPCTVLGQEALNALIRNPSSHARHYQHIRIVNWDGEMVVSAFLRLSKTGHNLFAEANYCLLPPLDESYHAIDSLSPFLNWSEWLNLVLLSGVTAGFKFFFLPLIVLEKVMGPLHRWQERAHARRAVRENPAFNYGALKSLREMASVNMFRRYFQKLDKEMHVKILERQIFDTIVRFLDSRNIDTSDLKERQSTILNNGLLVSGSGSIQAESLAVGASSQAFVDKVKQGGIRLLERARGKASSGN